ncbi:MAG: hypothetical protein HY699_03280 [Deltaproteobacteria bacterium]|nr:hypothetical protein [Deltaproteobacteria bacterium]
MGIALLACALSFNAFFLAPELWVGRLAWNDSTFHLVAAERLGQSLSRGEPLLDPWVSEWSLGYPLWRTYQPLPHLVAAGVLRLSEPFMSHAAAFAAFRYLLLTLLPFTAYAGARLFGLGSLGCGLVSLLILSPSGSGDFARYGLGYGSSGIRSGSGLYTQLFALHCLILFLGTLVRALASGRRRGSAGLLLAATVLSHMIFGYVALVSAALCAVVGADGQRPRRLVRLATIAAPALALLAWFAVPMLLASGEINHSRWEPVYKWDSFGAQAILWALGSGNLLDGHRLPLMTVLLAAGAATAAWSFRDAVARRLLALAGVWLLLFCGRVTWGHLLVLLAVPADFHLHRLQVAFELAAVLLAAWGIERAIYAVAARSRALCAAMAVCIAGALVAVGVERAGYLSRDARASELSLRVFEQQRTDLEQSLATMRVILAQRPGRASAGRRATWGDEFKVGDLPVYALLTLGHMDQVSFLYHAMSLTADVMELRDESDPAHDAVFGVRALIAPATQSPQPHWRRRGQHGPFAVYECSAEGYFGLVDVGARYTGPPSTTYEPNAAWLQSAWLRSGVVVALSGADPELPAVARWQPLPALPASCLRPRGHILNESKDQERYRAQVLLDRPCYALVKITWYPDLVATVDGHRAPILRVTPGFAAVPVSAGIHEVEVRYTPGPLKPILLILGILLFIVMAWWLKTPSAVAAEDAVSLRLARAAQQLAGARRSSALVLLGLVLLALHALFRGQLIDGHDAAAYPPRLVEFARALRDGQLPPLWAPDLGNGYGQPLFQFAPPLLYVTAYLLHATGCGLTDSLQLALVCLCGVGAVAVYRLGRRAVASRAAALGGAAAWLFVPYLALDLQVRAAFAETAAMAVAPAALLGLAGALDKPAPLRIALASALVALVPLAHNAVALLVLPALGLFVLAQRSRRAYGVGAMVLVGGLGLSAFFWLPALAEKAFVKTDLLQGDLLHWSMHAVSPAQLLWSRWDYGFSVSGTDDGMSFAIGPAHLLLAALGLVVALRSPECKRRREAVAFALAAAAGAWLATSWSAPVWSRVETLRYLAYPWRALLLPAMFLPLLIVPALGWLGARTRWSAVAVLVALNLAHTAPTGFLTYDEEYYSPDSIARRGINTTTYEEYEPRWVNQRPPYTSERLIGRPALASVRPISQRSAHQEFLVSAEEATVVEAATFYYPGWKLHVDGEETAIEPVPVRGTIRFRLPPGEHRVTLDLQPTSLRRFAGLLTLATLAALVLAMVGHRIVARSAFPTNTAPAAGAPAR